MSGNLHPLYRQKRCTLCADGHLRMGRTKEHIIHLYGVVFNYIGPCSAPTEDEYIAELESALGDIAAYTDELDTAERAKRALEGDKGAKK